MGPAADEYLVVVRARHDDHRAITGPSERASTQPRAQDKNGNWRGTLELGWANGKRQRKYLYGHTQREVREKLIAVQRGLADGQLPVPERLTVGRYFDEPRSPQGSPKRACSRAGSGADTRI